jgi:ABC-2 type transport system ATP-binding protein
VIFLDELTTGLDPAARRKMWDLVKEIRNQGKTIFLTTQYMDEAEKLCDRLAIMNNGNVVALDTPERIIQSYADNSGKTLHKVSLEDVFIALTSKETEE